MPRTIPLVALLLAGLVLRAPAAGQELPLKRDVPGGGPFRCSSAAPSVAPGSDERAQASQLRSDAAQAVILGDRPRARDLLARASELDPSSPSIAYGYGRILEDLGERRAAMDQYCRVLALDDQAREAADVRSRLDSLSRAEREAIPDSALADFRMGLASADAGRIETALEAFSRAVSSAPGWAEAAFDRGVVYARLGRREAAVADYRRYLELRPDAPDAIAVSERIGQLQAPMNLPNPGGALALGLLLPGMGQFYSGRPLGGLAVLTLVGGGVAAALLIEDIEVKCLTPTEPGQDCPAGQILSETRDRPFLKAGIGAAVGVSVIGAIEAFVKAKARRGGPGGELALRVGPMRLGLPTVVARGRTLDLRLVRLGF